MTTFNINSIPSQKGRIAIVTGANIGLGYETALSLAQKDTKVIMACRNLEKAEKAKADILKEAPNADLAIIQLDLSKLSSVREFAATFLSQYNQLDLLINNAGIMIPPFSLTEDGFESQIGTNYLGHFLLTGLLLDKIVATPDSRVVTLSSLAHQNGTIQFDDFHFKQDYSAMKAYGQSKLACLMFAIELDRRLKKAGVSTISVSSHPGISQTNLFTNAPKWMQILGSLFAPFFLQSAKAGAQPSLYAALGSDIEGKDYTGPDGKGERKGKAIKVTPKPHALDKEVAAKLWTLSEELTGISYLS